MSLPRKPKEVIEAEKNISGLKKERAGYEDEVKYPYKTGKYGQYFGQTLRTLPYSVSWGKVTFMNPDTGTYQVKDGWVHDQSPVYKYLYDKETQNGQNRARIDKEISQTADPGKWQRKSGKGDKTSRLGTRSGSTILTGGQGVYGKAAIKKEKLGAQS